MNCMKQLLYAVSGVALVTTLAAVVQASPVQKNAKSAKSSANPRVEMTVAKRGKVTIELFASETPKTAGQFLRLAKQGFYNGIRFHRVRAGFMAQAGDPGSKKFSAEQLEPLTDNDYGRLELGGGGSGKPIPFEATKRTHETGTLAMALSAPRSDTADSQFFINLVPNHRLDGDYCVFGRVVKGMDVVKKIKQGDAIESMKVVK
jgi:Peptidyl-prolyl cis-trans isomerase (rotamase) - cyclophilin family